MFSVCRIISRFHMAQALRSGVAAATRCSSQLDFGFPFLLEACWMSTRREIIVTTSLSEEIAQHTLDEIEKRVEVGISPKTKEEAKQVISSLTTCLEENKVLLKDAAVALAELRASMSQPDEYVTMEKIRNATKVLQRYDYRAGFWGVVGGQCLGILPPFIEELNYPMPENCAGGKTGVFVNGRELHQKDLRLLIARGLPRDRDRSYTVYITGRVIDEDTGEELDSLGKLAPTVDKLKRGFGMRVPRRHA